MAIYLGMSGSPGCVVLGKVDVNRYFLITKMTGVGKAMMSIYTPARLLIKGELGRADKNVRWVLQGGQLPAPCYDV